MLPDYLIGLDLGQVNDFTALAVVERPVAGAARLRSRFIRFGICSAWPLGMPYPQIVPAVARLATGAHWRAVTRLWWLIRRASAGPSWTCSVSTLVRVPIVPVTITAGKQRTATWTARACAEERVGHLSSVVVAKPTSQSGPKDCLMLRSLVRELLDFRVKITVAANETFGTWREGQHDDLVLAVALACWQAERSV